MGKPYLLLGPERGRKEEQVKKIIGETQQKTGEEAEIHRFYPFEASADEMIATASNGSLLSSNIVLLINQAETIKLKEASQFGEYFKNPNTDATLIFITEETASSKVTAFITKNVEKGNTIVFWEMFESDKKGWLAKFFHDAQLQIGSDGIDFILEMLENNTAEFRVVCQQIANFYPPGTLLTSEKMEEFLYHSKEESVFTLFSKISVGDFQGSMDILKKIYLGSGVYFPLLMGGLLWQFKKLLGWAQLSVLNYHPDEIANQLGVRAKRARQEYQKACSVYSVRNLECIVVLTIRMDSLLRESRGDVQKILMELYLYYVVEKKGECENFEESLAFAVV